MEKVNSPSKGAASSSTVVTAKAVPTHAVIKRKARASALSKYVRRMKTKIVGLSVPFIR
jgi:hypothetical protein